MIFTGIPCYTLAQADKELMKAESRVMESFSLMLENLAFKEDGKSLEQAETCIYEMKKALELPGSFEYAFDSLSNVTIITSSDHIVRIYTWNLPLQSGSNRFFGIVQYKDTENDTLYVIRLHDKTQEIQYPETALLSSLDWFGAIYYQIISNTGDDGKPFYTLLGWHTENILISSRVIDILTITFPDEITFGKKTFCGHETHNTDRPVRIIFRYASGASMVLQYEEQSIVKSKKWKRKTRQFEYEHESEWVIVCDRLVPGDPQLEGQYEYYYPAGSEMDGFVFRNGCWHFLTNIDVRNR